MSHFSEDIIKFNGIYKLPVNAAPTVDIGEPAADRLVFFKNILAEELDEMDEIIKAIKAGTPSIDVLTMLADLLGDIQVYCASEMAKFGLPLDQVLEVIMQSNFSKLGADGLPIYDERGKVQKGPNYWKPEPKIRARLKALQLNTLAERLKEEAKEVLAEAFPPPKEREKDFFGQPRVDPSLRVLPTKP